jgi:hypothetical protein
LMEGEYNTLGGDEKLVQNFSRKTWREEVILGDLGVDGG